MRYLLLLLAIPMYAQFGAAKQVVNGTGAPASAKCASANNVGLVYARKDGAGAYSTFYVCANSAASTYTWELMGAGGGSGVTSIDATGGVQTSSGAAITTTGTVRGAHVGKADTATTYTFLTGDRGKVVTLCNAAGVAVTLPNAGAGFEDGWFVVAKNICAGDAVVTPTTATISGAATATISNGEFLLISSNGTNYEGDGNRTVAGTGIVLTKARTGVTIAASGLADPGGNGFVDRTSAGITSPRTLTGTSNEVAVTNGGGGGNPVFSLSPALNLATKTVIIPSSTTLPATCAVGEEYMDTNATTGQRFYLCESTDTWVVQGAATAPGGSGTELQYRGGAATFSALGGSSIPAAGNLLIGTGITPTASAITSLFGIGAAIASGQANGNMLGINAPSGFTGILIQAELNGVDRFFVNNAGDGTFAGGLAATTAAFSGTLTGTTGTFSANINAGSTSGLNWSSRSKMFSPSDGVIELVNNGSSDFGRLQFGGTSSSFPALKRSTTALQVRLADDSNAGNFYTNALIGDGTTPTVSSGTIGTGSRNIAGFITSLTTGVYTGTLTFNGVTAPVGWACASNNMTAGTATFQTAYAATTATLSGATTSGDVIIYKCTAF